jgi:gliding motility-associated-like protein
MRRIGNPLFILFFTLILTISQSSAQVGVRDSLALVDLYNSTSGPQWKNSTNWLTTQPLGTWYGIGVSGTQVISIRLSTNGLVGSLPGSLGNLTALQYMEMDADSLSGLIPSTIGTLVNLTYLSLIENQLTGNIPVSLGNLTQLTWLRLSDNQLNGALPPALGNLSSLQYFYLGDNQFTGDIPPSLGNLTNLIYLQLYLNRLTGSIPSSLGNLPNLVDLELALNQLTGPIPASLGNNTNLQHLTLQYNQLSGPIPASLASLPLYDLYLDHNAFTFAGMEMVGQKPVTQKQYAPQASIPLFHQCGSKFWVSAGGTPANDTYTWYNNGIQVAQKVGDSTYSPASAGQIHVIVTNSLAPQLSLYSDTLSGDVVVNSPKVTICAGHSYTLPSGKTVNSTGTYQDTVRSAFGCDSLITLLDLTVNTSTQKISMTAAICGGQFFTLPSGQRISSAGLYDDTVRSAGGCDSVIFTVTLLADPLLQQAKDSFTLCVGSQVMLTAGPPQYAYSWNTGQTANAITVSRPATYVATATGTNGCIVHDTFQVANYASTPLKLDKNPLLCPGQTRLLDAGSGYQTYLWSDGSTGPSIAVTGTGAYWVLVTDPFHCSQSDSVVITAIVDPPPRFLSHDTGLCTNSSLKLSAQQVYAAYLWNTGETGSSITVHAPDNYWLRITDSHGCPWSDTITVSLQLNCTEGFFMPNGFTPNGDGHNDILRPLVLNNENLVKYRFEVYNRWGQTVFKSEQAGAGWDGTINGTKQEPAVFAWVVEYQFENRPAAVMRGTVLLIR